jgi:hypothetical protein
MSDIQLQKYSPVNPVLKKLIKFFWIIKSYSEANIYGKLIPTNNIDLIINFSEPIKYKSSTKEEIFSNTHFINSFKSFVGKTPSKLLKENDLIFELLENR